MSPRSKPNPPDKIDAQIKLQHRFASGDTDAFNTLVTPYLDTLYTLCLRICGNTSEADDLAQEAIIRALTRCTTYNPDRAFRPWMLTIATNLCRDRLRTVWWKRVFPFSQPQTSQTPSPEHTAHHTQRDEMVRAALLQVPLRYREALSLFYLDEMTYREMAMITEVSVSALKQRVRRGREMLRKAMVKLYPDLEAET